MYSNVIKNEEFIETVTSLSGQKLFDIKTLPDGTSVKTIFEEDGKNIKSIISYSSDGTVLKKEVLSTSSTSLSEDDESKIPKYLYHFTSIENYQSMIRDGLIKTSTDKLLSREGNRGIFLVDSNNLLNGWQLLKMVDLSKLKDMSYFDTDAERIAKEIVSSVL